MSQHVTITPEQLRKIAPHVKQKAAEVFLPYINAMLPVYGLNTVQRVAAFLAELLHESGGFQWVREVWGPTPQQRKYERDFKEPWKEGLDRSARNYLPFQLGNSQPGDGKFYKGRGLVQITGRSNYRLASIALFGREDTLIKNPELLEVPEYAVKSAFWFICINKKLLAKLDSPGVMDERKAINGGLNGLADVQGYYDRAVKVLTLSA